MTFGPNSPKFSVSALACTLLLAVLFVGPSASALPDIVLEVGDTTASPGATNSVISVYLSNFNETVAGFNIWLQLDRPDILIFQTDIDTVIDTTYWKCIEYSGPTCIDSAETTPLEQEWFTIDTNEVQIGNFDVTGTMIQNWESVQALSIGGQGRDLNIVGIANLPSGPITPGIAPQQGGLLIKLLADVLSIPDTMTNRTVNILVQHNFIDHFSFSGPTGQSIGLKDTVVVDTNFWVCTSWAGDVCLGWQRVSQPPADSFVIVQDTVSVVDYSMVFITDGSLTVDEGLCGDADGSATPNIGDVVYIVNYLFKGGTPPIPYWVGDVNCDGIVNIGDLTYFVNYLFKDGPALCAGC